MHKDLKTLYREKVVPSMIKDFGYKNIEQVPKVVKISVNRGLGEASKNSKELEASLREIAVITGGQMKGKKIFLYGKDDFTQKLPSEFVVNTKERKKLIHKS